jgi:ATP synthase protein I
MALFFAALLVRSEGFVSGSERRSPLAQGMEWASKISTLGLVFALPPLLGLYLDRRLGMPSVGILAGMVIGFASGMFYVLRMARDSSKPT